MPQRLTSHFLWWGTSMNSKFLCLALTLSSTLVCDLQAQAVAQGRILASDAAPASSFSYNMDIDGDVAVISNSSSTNPYIFVCINGQWVEVARLAPAKAPQILRMIMPLRSAATPLPLARSESAAQSRTMGQRIFLKKSMGVGGKWQN